MMVVELSQVAFLNCVYMQLEDLQWVQSSMDLWHEGVTLGSSADMPG